MADLFKITHSPGHALTTPGKESPDGVKEWAQASEICKLVIAELANYENVAQKRVDDVTGKVDISRSKRIQEINDWGAHVHIDYHLNAAGVGWNDASGVEVFIKESKPTAALDLATKLQSNLVQASGFKNRGVKFENFDMVYYPKCTAVLIEFGFMTNKGNTDFIRSAEGKKKLAQAVVDALVSQFGLKKRVVVPKDTTKYRLRSGTFANAIDFAKAVGIVKGKGWLVYEKADSLDFNPTYRFLTGTFEGRELAYKMAAELKPYGWLIYVDKA